MKKLLLIALFYFCSTTVYSQSIGLLDLTNLTSLKSEQVDDYFVARKVFRLQFGEEVNGFMVKHYQTNSKTSKQETVLTGGGFKAASDLILYSVSYVTSDPQNIINLINQTKNIGLKLTLQGADQSNNIYIYDNDLYHVVFKLKINQTAGTVDITQKQVFTQ